MVKFCKDGSDATSGAVRLARAYTGRDIVACCVDHPFFSTDDWFIGTTPMNSGVPVAVRNLTVTFRYNDIASVRDLFDRHSGQLAALILEPSRGDDPREGFLHEVQRLCRENGALLIFDEMITGFRWHAGGAQKLYGVEPDLSAFGKALGNGFSVSAYAQRTCCVAHRRAAQDSEPGTRSACLPTLRMGASGTRARSRLEPDWRPAGTRRRIPPVRAELRGLVGPGRCKLPPT